MGIIDRIGKGMLVWIAFATAAILPMSCALAAVTVDFSKTTGAVKRLNGVCGWARIVGDKYGSHDHLLRELDIPEARFHDAPLDNPGLQLVDVSRIFPLFHLDADDPRNYDFRATDDLLRKVHDAGVEIEFRLGESIEHSRKHYYVKPPSDFAKWADICVHIVRHYNEGWADGFRWGIRDWSIWEEPTSVPELFDTMSEYATPQEGYEKVYFPLYEVTAKRLKECFPNIRVMGPQCGGTPEAIKNFIDYCADRKLPLDVFGFTQFFRDPDKYFDMARSIRALLDEKGYRDTRISLCEWHWGPISWKGHGSWESQEAVDEFIRDVAGVKSGAFAAAMLSRGQDSPLDTMYYYIVSSSSMHWWGLIGEFGHKYPSWYALKAFAEVAALKKRVLCPSRFDGNWFAIASRDDDRGKILASVLSQDGALEIDVKGGMIPVSVRCFDGINKLAPIDDWSWQGGRLKVQRRFSESGFWLIDLKQDDGSLDRHQIMSGKVADAARFNPLNDFLPAALKFLGRADLTTLKPGRYNITPHRCWAYITEGEADPPDDGYIEIQAPIAGNYRIKGSDKSLAVGEYAMFFPPFGSRKVGITPTLSEGCRKLVIKVWDKNRMTDVVAP